MSGTIQSLNRRIIGAGDLQGVVRSMKALAASSIAQYEKAVQSLDGYYRTVELGLSACFRQSGSAAFALQEAPRRAVRIGAVVFGSDQGLVGRFNEVLAEYVTNSLKSLPGKTAKIWAVGERIHELMADTGLTQTGFLSVPASVAAITPFVGQILTEIEAASEKEDVTEIYLFYNHPKSGALYEPVSKRLLPLDHIWQRQLAALPWPTKNLPEIIGAVEQELPALIRGYLFVVLFQACAESLASENGSRLAAMQRAEKNINEILAGLNQTFHRVRQESIDEELFEVVSGFEALTGQSNPPRRAAIGRLPSSTGFR